MSATNRGSERIALDGYPTPTWLSEAMMPYLIPYAPRLVLEPACGEGKLTEVLERMLPNAIIDQSDIAAPYYQDFLTLEPTPKYDLIITNPPFSLAIEFAQHAMKFRRCEMSLVCLLLRVNFLGSRKRAEWLRANMPTSHVTPARPSFGKLNKHGKKGTDATEYAWMLWDGHPRPTVILDTENIDTSDGSIRDTVDDDTDDDGLSPEQREIIAQSNAATDVFTL